MGGIVWVLEPETLIALLPRMRLEVHRRLACDPRRQLHAPSIPFPDQTAPNSVPSPLIHIMLRCGYQVVDAARLPAPVDTASSRPTYRRGRRRISFSPD